MRLWGLTLFGGYRLSGFWGCGDCSVFEGYRRIWSGGCSVVGGVDGLDLGGDGLDRLRVGGELVSVVELGFQGGAEALVLNVAPAHPGASDRK